MAMEDQIGALIELLKGFQSRMDQRHESLMKTLEASTAAAASFLTANSDKCSTTSMAAPSAAQDVSLAIPVADSDYNQREVHITTGAGSSLCSASPRSARMVASEYSLLGISNSGTEAEPAATSLVSGCTPAVPIVNSDDRGHEVVVTTNDRKSLTTSATPSASSPPVATPLGADSAVIDVSSDYAEVMHSNCSTPGLHQVATAEFTFERKKVQIEARPVSLVVPFEQDAVRILDCLMGDLSAPCPPLPLPRLRRAWRVPRLRWLRCAPLRSPSLHRPRRSPPRPPWLRRPRRAPPRPPRLHCPRRAPPHRRGRPPRLRVRGRRPRLRARALLPQPSTVHRRVRASRHQRRWRARGDLHAAFLQPRRSLCQLLDRAPRSPIDVADRTGSSTTVPIVEPVPFTNLPPTKCSMQILNNKLSSSSSLWPTSPITPVGNLSTPLAALPTMPNWTGAKEAVSSTIPMYILIYSSAYSVDVVLSSSAFEKQAVQKACEGLLAQDTLHVVILGDSIQLQALSWPSFSGYAALVLLKTSWSAVTPGLSFWWIQIATKPAVLLVSAAAGSKCQPDALRELDSVQSEFRTDFEIAELHCDIGNSSHLFAVKSTWRGSLLGPMEMQLSCGDWGPYFEWNGTEKSVQAPLLLKSPWPPPMFLEILGSQVEDSIIELRPNPWPSFEHSFYLIHRVSYMLLSGDTNLQQQVSILHLLADPSKCRVQWKPPWLSYVGRNIAGHCHTSSFIMVLSGQGVVAVLLMEVQARCLITCLDIELFSMGFSFFSPACPKPAAQHNSMNKRPAHSERYHYAFVVPVPTDRLLLCPPDTSSSTCKCYMDSSSTITFDPGITSLSTGLVMSMSLLNSSIDALHELCALLLKVTRSTSEKEQAASAPSTIWVLVTLIEVSWLLLITSCLASSTIIGVLTMEFWVNKMDTAFEVENDSKLLHYMIVMLPKPWPLIKCRKHVVLVQWKTTRLPPVQFKMAHKVNKELLMHTCGDLAIVTRYIQNTAMQGDTTAQGHTEAHSIYMSWFSDWIRSSIGERDKYMIFQIHLQQPVFHLHVQVAASQIKTKYWHVLPLTNNDAFWESFDIRKKHVLWDPGGLLQQRLGDKPLFKVGRMSGYDSVLQIGPSKVEWAGLILYQPTTANHERHNIQRQKLQRWKGVEDQNHEPGGDELARVEASICSRLA